MAESDAAQGIGDQTAGLAAAFLRGDQAVVGDYFRENTGLLLGMARRIAPSHVDPEDLLADAIASLLTQWAKHAGPREHINTYIVKSMRNRVKDELRSPRSRILGLAVEMDAPAEPSPLLRRAELGNEIGLAQAALERLPADQRLVLQEMVVNGHKPRDLEGVLKRPASSITALAVRAKQGLRRAMLQTLIAEGTDECKKALRQVPNPTPLKLPAQDTRGRPTHFAGCDHCQRSWARFAALPSALGLTTLLVVADALSPGTAASAAASEPSRDHVPPSQRDRRRNRGLLLLGAVSLVAAGFAAFLLIDLPPSQPAADVEVLRQPVDHARILYSVDLRIATERWSMESATFTGPDQISAVTPPPGWTCSIDDTRAVCETTGRSHDLVDFVVQYEGSLSIPAFALQVVATTSGGITVVADASGAGTDGTG